MKSKKKTERKDPMIHGGPVFVQPDSYRKIKKIAAAKLWSDTRVIAQAMANYPLAGK